MERWETVRTTREDDLHQVKKKISSKTKDKKQRDSKERLGDCAHDTGGRPASGRKKLSQKKGTLATASFRHFKSMWPLRHLNRCLACGLT